MKSPRLVVAALAIFALVVARFLPAEEPKIKPLQVLLVCGGCCHDYDAQKDLIAKGLEERAHVQVTVVQQGGTVDDLENSTLRKRKVVGRLRRRHSRRVFLGREGARLDGAHPQTAQRGAAGRPRALRHALLPRRHRRVVQVLRRHVAPPRGRLRARSRQSRPQTRDHGKIRDRMGQPGGRTLLDRKTVGHGPSSGDGEEQGKGKRRSVRLDE